MKTYREPRHASPRGDSGNGISNWIILLVTVILLGVLLGMAYTHSTERITMPYPNVYRIDTPSNYYVLVMGHNTSEALLWASDLLPEDPTELTITIPHPDDYQGERIPNVSDEEFFPIIEETQDERANSRYVELPRL